MIVYVMFNMMDMLRILIFVTGGLIAGEALALTVGMHLPSEKDNP
jgi:hypothetical protein